MESFDSFLIGLPNEMKTSDCKINQPNAKVYVKPGKSIAEAQPRIILPTLTAKHQIEKTVSPIPKRQCTSNEDVVAAGGAVQSQRPNLVSNQHSTQSKTVLKGTDKIGAATNVQKSVSFSKRTKVSRIRIPDNVNVDDDIIFCGISTSTPNARKAIEAPKNVNVERVTDDTFKYLKNLQRRMSIAESMVSIPKDPLKASEVSAERKEAAPPKDSQAKVVSEKSTKNEKKCDAVAKVDNRKKPVNKEVLSVTLPAVAAVVPNRGVMTRSRRQTIHEKPTLRCDECDYTTSVRTNLLRHSLVHSGEKPFKCDVCDKGFTQKNNLMSHHRTNHKNLY